MNAEDISEKDWRLWGHLFSRRWYAGLDYTINAEIVKCFKDAKAGNEHAQQYITEFTAAKMQGE